MFRLSRILPLAIAAAAISVIAAPAGAFVGYGIEAGTPLYDALQDGYRPYPYYHHYYYYAPPPRRGYRMQRRYRGG